MLVYLIDENMPYYFRLWNTPEFVHQLDIAPKAKDRYVWQYAIDNNLTIITKDSDFSNRIMLQQPPPRVIHFRTGNMSVREFYKVIHESWAVAQELSRTHKLVCVYNDRIEAFE